MCDVLGSLLVSVVREINESFYNHIYDESGDLKYDISQDYVYEFELVIHQYQCNTVVMWCGIQVFNEDDAMYESNTDEELRSAIKSDILKRMQEVSMVHKVFGGILDNVEDNG